MIYPLGSFQIFNAVLLTSVTMLYIIFPGVLGGLCINHAFLFFSDSWLEGWCMWGGLLL